MAQPQLTYFDGPGRAELTRLAFHAGGVAFEDNRLGFPEFGALKGDASKFGPGQFFGSLPVLKHGDVEIAQSIALSQYAADLALGAKTPAQRAKDTMILGAHADIQVAMYKCLFGDEESKAKGQAELDANTEKFLAGIERHLPASGFLHGEEKPSIGDLAIFDFVTSKFPGLKALGRDLAAFPKINALVAAVQAYPGLSAYLGARGF